MDLGVVEGRSVVNLVQSPLIFVTFYDVSQLRITYGFY